MANLQVDITRWLPAAQAGSKEALGQVLEACRGYLLLIAREELDPALQAKGSASDLVQQTFLEAQKDLPRFQGSSPEALLGWMRRLLLNNLSNFRRDFQRDKRRASREVSLAPVDSAAPGHAVLSSDLPTPSVALMRNEQTTALEDALARLPEHYQRVIHLRYREEQSFEAIAQQMQRSPNAVRKLWARAIEHLQQELEVAP